MAAKMSFRQFLNNIGPGIGTGDFQLGARDAFEMYSYIWDTLRFRQGGLWNLWKKMPGQTYHEMADEWADANPHLAHLRDGFWQPEMIRQLGFRIGPDDVVNLS